MQEAKLSDPGIPPGDPPSEQLDSLGAAAEFTRICMMLDGRRDAAYLAGEDYWASGERIYAGNPTGRLRELLEGHYAGTPTAKARLLTDGFIEHGYNEGDIVSDTPFGEWPRELGMDIEKGIPGAFEKEGARQIERRDLLHIIPLRITVELDSFHEGAYLDEARALMEALLRQAEEYEEVFGEPYDRPKIGDSELDLDKIANAAKRRESTRKFLEDHPFPNS